MDIDLVSLMADIPTEFIIGGVIILATFVFQYYIKRLTQAKKKATLDCTVHPTGPRNKSYDYVVLGAGPGGCAAASRLVALHKKKHQGADCSVLLLDQGVASVGTNLVLPSMQPYWGKSAIDGGEFATGPFAEAGVVASTDSNTLGVTGEPAAKKWVSRGSGIGGTTLIDYGIHFFPSGDVQTEVGVTKAEITDLSEFVVDPYDGKELEEGQKERPVVKDGAPVEVRLNSFRSPLAWGFAEAASVGCDYDKRLPSETEPYPGSAAEGLEGDNKKGPRSGRFIFPFWLRSSRQSRKENFYHHDVASKKQIDMVPGWTVVKAPTMDAGTVSSVEVCMSKRHDLGAKSKTVTIKKGLVLACGTYGTAKLLQQWSKSFPGPSKGLSLLTSGSPQSVVSYDTLSVPLVYQCLPGLSNDPCNISSAWNQVKSAWGKQTTLLNAVTDSAATLTLENGVTLMIQFVPSGGFNRDLFKRMDRSEALGLFKEACEFKVTAMIPTKVNLVGGTTKDATAEKQLDEEEKEHRQLLVDSLVRGLELSREIVQCKPLNQLTTQKEVLDISLFPATLGSNNRPRRTIFKILYGKAPKKNTQTRQYKREAGEMINEARQFALSKPYLESYVKAHAGFSGYACGSLVGQKEKNSSSSSSCDALIGDLLEMNIAVADASRISPASLASIGGGGTVALATVMGWKAASEIVGGKKQ